MIIVYLKIASILTALSVCISFMALCIAWFDLNRANRSPEPLYLKGQEIQEKESDLNQVKKTFMFFLFLLIVLLLALGINIHLQKLKDIQDKERLIKQPKELTDLNESEGSFFITQYFKA